MRASTESTWCGVKDYAGNYTRSPGLDLRENPMEDCSVYWKALILLQLLMPRSWMRSRHYSINSGILL